MKASARSEEEVKKVKGWYPNKQHNRILLNNSNIHAKRPRSGKEYEDREILQKYKRPERLMNNEQAVRKEQLSFEIKREIRNKKKRKGHQQFIS